MSLIMTRAKGQKIVFSVDDVDIYVTFIDDENGNYTIGMDAPKKVRILKGEFFERNKTNGHVRAIIEKDDDRGNVL